MPINVTRYQNQTSAKTDEKQKRVGRFWPKSSHMPAKRDVPWSGQNSSECGHVSLGGPQLGMFQYA